MFWTKIIKFFKKPSFQLKKIIKNYNILIFIMRIVKYTLDFYNVNTLKTMNKIRCIGKDAILF